MENCKEIWVINWYDFPFYEGTTARIKGLVSVLKRNRMQVTVLSPLFHREYPPKKDEIPCDVEYIDLRWLRFFGDNNKPVKLLAVMIFWLAAFARLVLVSRNKNIIVQYEHVFSSLPAVLMRSLFGTVIIGDDIHLFSRAMKSLPRLITNLFEVWVCQQTDVLITSFKMDYMILKYTFNRKKTLFVPNGISSVASLEKLVTKRKILLFVGSLSYADNQRAVKSLLGIAEELSRLRNDFEVLVVGGPLKAVNTLFGHDVVQKGILKFLGYVSDGTLKEIYQKASIGLLPYFGEFSHTSQRVKALEYFANGLAVVSSPQGVDGIPGLKTGTHFIEASSASQMVKALDFCLLHPEVLRKMSIEGRDSIVAKYSWSAVSKKYADLIHDLINSFSQSTTEDISSKVAQRPASSFTVCIVTSHRLGETLGGIETFTFSLFRWLREAGINSVILARKLSTLIPFLVVDSNDISFNPSGARQPEKRQLPYALYLLYMFYFSILTAFPLISICTKLRCRVIHAQDSFGGFSAVMVGKLLRIPVVEHAHGPEIYHVRSAFQRSFVTAIDKFVWNRADKGFATDALTMDYLVSLGVSPRKIQMLPVAIKLAEFQHISGKIRRNSTYRNKEFVVGCVGRLSREKNLARLVEAFAIFTSEVKTESRLYLVGDGPERTNLEVLVREKGIAKQVAFTGWRNNVAELLDSFDVFALPSLFEGSPIALLEAMAAGKAIVASNIPSVRAIVRQGEEVVLVNPYSVEDLERALLLLYNDPALRARLGEKAREKARIYDANNIYGQILKVYEELVSASRQTTLSFSTSQHNVV